MAERKTIQKYYPADFDPAKLARLKHSSIPARTIVNFACPFRSMRCLSCGHYTTKGKVFRNSPRRICPERYLGIRIVRLHCKCPGCAAEIVIDTDPKNMDYRIVSGAKREYEVWRDGERAEDTVEQRLHRLETEKDEEVKATMETLERKTDDAKVDVAVADALDHIRAANTRRERAEARFNVGSSAKMSGAKDDERDAEIARAAFRDGKRSGVLTGTKSSSSESESPSESLEVKFPVFRPVKKVKRDFAKALGIKR